MEQKIFREVSLKRLSSPEQLDQLIKVTSPRGWLALIALSLLLAAAIVWSITGSLPTKITGQGILLNNGGVFSLTHDTAGQVLDVRFKTGDKVKKGDVIARINQPELTAEINSLLDTLRDLEETGRAGTAEYHTLKDKVAQLREELKHRTQIIAPIEGRILDMYLYPGSVVQPGQTLASLEEYGATVRLEAILYLPAELAGKIRPGMEAQISPTIVNKEEYGYMWGRVTSVADYPATSHSIMQTLGNENLVTYLAGQGASVKVRVDLVPDGRTVSGYKWSSPDGPPITIAGGTLIQGAVVIDREKPISKVIPIIGAQSGEK
jgi:multidrug efflux pump subunit AcrA (membrane-fusion protein)